MLSHDEIDTNHPILTTTLDDVPGLDEDIEIAEVLDLQLSDVPCFVNGCTFALHGLLQGTVSSRWDGILPVEEEEGEIFEGVGTRDAGKVGVFHAHHHNEGWGHA